MSDYPISHFPARALRSGANLANRLAMRVKQRFPRALGLAVLGPYVQFYREDGLFSTELALFNYLSSFLPSVETSIEYRVAAFDRAGRNLGSGSVRLAHGASTQVRLREILDRPLDEYGLFHVMAVPHTADPERVSAIGPTTGQFMTIFAPTDPLRQAAQFIHSHKLLHSLPLPPSAITRETHITEDLAAQAVTEFYFLNPCQQSTALRLDVHELDSDRKVFSRHAVAPPRGVARITLERRDIGSSSGLVSFRYGFSRRISHQKPIVFRHQAGGVVTCNHS